MPPLGYGWENLLRASWRIATEAVGGSGKRYLVGVVVAEDQFAAGAAAKASLRAGESQRYGVQHITSGVPKPRASQQGFGSARNPETHHQVPVVTWGRDRLAHDPSSWPAAASDGAAGSERGFGQGPAPRGPGFEFICFFKRKMSFPLSSASRHLEATSRGTEVPGYVRKGRKCSEGWEQLDCGLHPPALPLAGSPVLCYF